jgi:hypothetical protein
MLAILSVGSLRESGESSQLGAPNRTKLGELCPRIGDPRRSDKTAKARIHPRRCARQIIAAQATAAGRGHPSKAQIPAASLNSSSMRSCPRDVSYIEYVPIHTKGGV